MDFGYGEDSDDFIGPSKEYAIISDSKEEEYRRKSLQKVAEAKWWRKKCAHFDALYKECLNATYIKVPYITCSKELSLFERCVKQIRNQKRNRDNIDNRKHINSLIEKRRSMEKEESDKE